MEKLFAGIQIVESVNNRRFFSVMLPDKINKIKLLFEIKSNGQKLKAEFGRYKIMLDEIINFSKDFTLDENERQKEYTSRKCKEDIEEVIRLFRQACIIYSHWNLIKSK